MQKRAEGGGMRLFLKGILIGLLFGVPVGAVGAMTVQRTWEHGIKAGLLTGMESWRQY
jgi:ABC-type antimicrobial peptide transport system permease subunit